MDVLAVALALVVGLLVGYGACALRVARMMAGRRAVAGAASGFARLWPETLPERSAADIVAGRITVALGGVPYTLRVLPRRASAEWLADLDERFAYLRDALDQAGDDKPRILELLAGQSPVMLAALRAYDVDGVLPDDEYVETYGTDAEILRATIEVWRAANPLAATLAEKAASGTTDTTSSEESSSPPPPTDGTFATSTIT